MKEILDAAEPAGAGANRRDQYAGAGVDAALGGGVTHGVAQQARGQILVGRRERRTKQRRAEA